MSIIDCRFRPSTPEFMGYLEPEPHFFSVLKSRPPKPESLETSIKHLKSVGVTGAVIHGREWAKANQFITNDHIAELVKKHTDFNIIGVAGVDADAGEEVVCSKLEYAIKELKLKGVSLDPFAIESDCADERFYPIYQLCQDYNVPVMITLGPFPAGYGYMQWCSPFPADKVANDFPNLKILLTHGGFPHTQEFIAIVWRNKNVYFENSLFYNMPGADMVVEAVNNLFPEKMVYASAYPSIDYYQSLKDFYKMGYKDSVLPMILHENAKRLFDVSF